MSDAPWQLSNNQEEISYLYSVTRKGHNAYMTNLYIKLDNKLNTYEQSPSLNI